VASATSRADGGCGPSDHLQVFLDRNLLVAEVNLHVVQFRVDVAVIDTVVGGNLAGGSNLLAIQLEEDVRSRNEDAVAVLVGEVDLSFPLFTLVCSSDDHSGLVIKSDVATHAPDALGVAFLELTNASLEPHRGGGNDLLGANGSTNGDASGTVCQKHSWTTNNSLDEELWIESVLQAEEFGHPGVGGGRILWRDGEIQWDLLELEVWQQSGSTGPDSACREAHLPLGNVRILVDGIRRQARLLWHGERGVLQESATRAVFCPRAVFCASVISAPITWLGYSTGYNLRANSVWMPWLCPKFVYSEIRVLDF